MVTRKSRPKLFMDFGSDLFEVVEKAGIRFGHAFAVDDLDLARRREAGDRPGHGDSVIAMGIDGSALRFAALDLETVRR